MKVGGGEGEEEGESTDIWQYKFNSQPCIQHTQHSVWRPGSLLVVHWYQSHTALRCHHYPATCWTASHLREHNVTLTIRSINFKPPTSVNDLMLCLEVVQCLHYLQSAQTVKHTMPWQGSAHSPTRPFYRQCLQALDLPTSWAVSPDMWPLAP